MRLQRIAPGAVAAVAAVVTLVAAAALAIAAPAGAAQLAAAAGAPPTEAFGIGLGASPAAVAAVLARDYPPCAAVRSIYRAGAGAAAAPLAVLSVNQGLATNDPGSVDICSHSPAGQGITDSIEAKFVHPGIEPEQPVYSLKAHRLYPDAIYGAPPHLRKTFDALRDELFRRYGKPVDERRERVATGAANLATSMGIGRQVQREDFRVRYLWAANGRLVDEEYEDSTCRCSGPYVKATIEMSRSPQALPGRPKNVFYVLAVTLTVENQALAATQNEWNAQWQRPGGALRAAAPDAGVKP
jgi:hypothetical protein